jgi:hypothetical protein
MKKFFLILLLLSVIFNGNSQQRTPSISFSQLVWDYGEIREENGIANHKFEFTNTGSLPLVIHNVTASCGCTAPSWTREPVMPGGKGFVNAAFDPAGRPGHFDKTITVNTNAVPGAITLRIIGKVTPKTLSVEDEFRYPMGSLRFKSNHISFATVYVGKEHTKKEEMINNSDQTLSIEFKNIPSHIKVTPSSLTLNPGQKGSVQIVYDGAKRNDWGFLIDNMDVFVNGKNDRTFKLIISANIEENFAALTPEQKASAPVISFKETTFNIGSMKEGENAEYEYVFTNTGNSDLIIRKVVPSCGCTATILSKHVISPGESGVIRTVFNFLADSRR